MTGGPEKIERLKHVNYSVALNIILLLIILTHSIIRDTYLEKQYTGDLRNRIVGARLQKDGRLPYFYYWQAKDGIRYFDPRNSNLSSATVSPITASPFFHQLLYPICDLDQQTLSKIWFVFQYILLAAMVWMACRMTENINTRWLLVNTGVLFTMTEAWKSLMENGQIYLFYAFLMFCIISGILSKKRVWTIVAGLIMAVWILNRPIGIISLIPIFLLYKQQRLFFFTAMTSLLLYAVFVLSSPFEKSLWLNYMEGIRMQVRLHQNADPKAVLAPRLLPENRQLEGIDFDTVDKNMAEHPITVYSENGNFFVLYRTLTHHKISLGWLNFLSLLTIVALMGFFYYSYKKNNGTSLQVLIFAFTLYMIIEIFNPVYRHQYNTVQWFPLVLVALLIPMKWTNPGLLLLALGLLLNIINVSWIPMRHTLGEFAWLASMLYLSCTNAETKHQDQAVA
jgi:hypothetical protein